MRVDWENYAPKVVRLIQQTTRVHVEKNVAEILDMQEEWPEDGPLIRSKDIEAIIWSPSLRSHRGPVHIPRVH